MGGCFSDVKGGQQAVGGVTKVDGSGAGHNDAVDYFFRARGEHGPFRAHKGTVKGMQLV